MNPSWKTVSLRLAAVAKGENSEILKKVDDARKSGKPLAGVAVFARMLAQKDGAREAYFFSPAFVAMYPGLMEELQATDCPRPASGGLFGPKLLGPDENGVALLDS